MKIKINKNETIDKYEWNRVFIVFPVKTEDGYFIFLNYVWEKCSRILSDYWLYHTNPERKEDEYQAIKLGYQPLTEGSTLTKNLRGESVIIPKRPPPPPQPPAKKCPKCGTTDCYSGPAKFDISGAGVLSTTSKDIVKSCKFRQQLRALERINITRTNNVIIR